MKKRIAILSLIAIFISLVTVTAQTPATTKKAPVKTEAKCDKKADAKCDKKADAKCDKKAEAKCCDTKKDNKECCKTKKEGEKTSCATTCKKTETKKI